MIEIAVNGKTTTFENNKTLTDLVNSMDIGNQRFAIEVNKELVPRSTFDDVTIKEGDKIEIVGAIGGG